MRTRELQAVSHSKKMVEGDTVVQPDSRPTPELHPAGS